MCVCVLHGNLSKEMTICLIVTYVRPPPARPASPLHLALSRMCSFALALLWDFFTGGDSTNRWTSAQLFKPGRLQSDARMSSWRVVGAVLWRWRCWHLVDTLVSNAFCDRLGVNWPACRPSTGAHYCFMHPPINRSFCDFEPLACLLLRHVGAHLRRRRCSHCRTSCHLGTGNRCAWMESSILAKALV